MEKFGIFELLDALSALTAQNVPPEEPSGQNGAEPPAPRKPDEAFAPPAYGNETTAKTGGKETDALADFLARHDAVARKAERK